MTLQGIFAVAAGFVAMTAVVMIGIAALMITMQRKGPDASGEAPAPTPAYIAGDLMVGLVAALTGGALTAWLAPFLPFHHAMGLAGLVVAMSIVCAIAYGNSQPRWYQAMLGLCAPLAVLGGAWLRQSLG